MQWGVDTKHDFFGKKNKKNKNTISQGNYTTSNSDQRQNPCISPTIQSVKGVKPTDSSYYASLGFGEDKDDCTGIGKILECSQTYKFQFLTLLSTFGEETLT